MRRLAKPKSIVGSDIVFAQLKQEEQETELLDVEESDWTEGDFLEDAVFMPLVIYYVFYYCVTIKVFHMDVGHVNVVCLLYGTAGSIIFICINLWLGWWLMWSCIW